MASRVVYRNPNLSIKWTHPNKSGYTLLTPERYSPDDLLKFILDDFQIPPHPAPESGKPYIHTFELLSNGVPTGQSFRVRVHPGAAEVRRREIRNFTASDFDFAHGGGTLNLVVNFVRGSTDTVGTPPARRRLEAPTGLTVQDNYATWNKVEGASTYSVYINGQPMMEIEETKIYIPDIDDIFETFGYGNHTIKIRANGSETPTAQNIIWSPSLLSEGHDFFLLDTRQLNALIQSVRSKRQNHYTTSSWDYMYEVLQAALGVINCTESTQDDVDKITEMLQAAYDKLVRVCRIDINCLLLNALRKYETQYTSSTWTVMSDKLLEALEVRNNWESIQAEIDVAYDALRKAVDALVKRADYSELATLILNSLARIQANYTATSWNKFVEARNAALVARQSTDMGQAELDKYTDALRSAIADLRLKAGVSEIDAIIAEAKNRNEADYTPNSWSHLQDVIVDAKLVADKKDPTPTQIETAIKDLKAAMESLVLRADKSALNALILQAEAKVSSAFTNVSWALFVTGLSHALGVRNNANASNDMVEEAWKKLDTVMGGLVLRTDIGALKALIAELEALDPSNFTAASFAYLEFQLGVAIEIRDDEASTCEDIECAITSLVSAKSALVRYWTVTLVMPNEVIPGTYSVSPVKATVDTDVTVSAGTLFDGYAFDRWVEIGGNTVIATMDDSASKIATFPMPNNNVVLAALVKTYSKQPSTDASLYSLNVTGHSLNTVFDPEVLTYSVDILGNESFISISAKSACPHASVLGGQGDIQFMIYEIIDGVTSIEVPVVAQNGTSKTYVINLNRL